MWKGEKRKLFLFSFLICLAVGGLLSQRRRKRSRKVQKETKMAVMFVPVGK